jgi:hypothetical protein
VEAFVNFVWRRVTEERRSVRLASFVFSMRWALRAASFALFASISARRRSAREVVEDIGGE